MKSVEIDCANPNRGYLLKSEVKYRRITGMNALGNQCKDCVNSEEFESKSLDELKCNVVKAKVNSKYTCRAFKRRPL
jgi:hypothetical protein